MRNLIKIVPRRFDRCTDLSSKMCFWKSAFGTDLSAINAKLCVLPLCVALLPRLPAWPVAVSSFRDRDRGSGALTRVVKKATAMAKSGLARLVRYSNFAVNLWNNCASCESSNAVDDRTVNRTVDAGVEADGFNRPEGNSSSTDLMY